MIVVGLSGASGPIMGIRLIEELLRSKEEVTAVVSSTARQIIEHEVLGTDQAYTCLADIITQRNRFADLNGLAEYDNSDFFSPSASGSSAFEAVAVVPCSMKTMAAIANGFADSLITRVCDVALKEKRRCIIVPRETPLNLIHIQNMYRAAKAGVEILPPVPGFYTQPKTVDDVVDFVVGKILSLLGRKHTLFKEWGNE